MAESYIVTIKFTPSNNSLRETENRLMKVFNRVTNGFKNGFAKAWKGLKIGSGIMGMATALTALLNPLSALNDRINATLTKAGSIKDRAAGAGTDIKTYLALQGYAASKNISEETLSSAISRMQVLIGDAKAGNENALSNYADETDMGKVFYNVMNQLSKLQGPDRAAMAAEIFGKNALVGLGPLLTEGFRKDTFNELLNGIDLGAVEKGVYQLDDRANQKAKYDVRREWRDMVAKGEKITPDIIKFQAAQEAKKLEGENRNLNNYESLSAIEQSVQSIKNDMATIVSWFDPIIILLAGALKVVCDLPKKLEWLWDKISHWRPWGNR